MANYSYTNNGIDFTIEGDDIMQFSKLRNASTSLKYGKIKSLVNAVEIDWNGAQLSYVSLPNVLDNGNTVNTTGQLLALKNNLQSRLSA